MKSTDLIVVLCTGVMLSHLSFASSLFAPGMRLSRNGFTSAAGLAPRGSHRASGWSVGIPLAGLARHDAANDALYAGFWYMQFFAIPPPAPGIIIPKALLPGATGAVTTLDYSLQIVGGKPPTVPYPYHAYVIAFTNGLRCAQSFVSQLPDNSQWSLNLPLNEGEEIELALVSSNVFGESAATTVLMVAHIPEPLCLAGLLFLALACHRLGRHHAA